MNYSKSNKTLNTTRNTNPSRNIGFLSPLSNPETTYATFVNEDVEYVSKLKFYKTKKVNQRKSLYSLNTLPLMRKSTIKVTQTKASFSSPLKNQGYKKKLNNELLEDKFERQRVDSEKYIEKYKNQIDLLYQELEEVNAKIGDIKLDVNVLTNYNSYTNIQGKINKFYLDYDNKIKEKETDKNKNKDKIQERLELKMKLERILEEKLEYVKEKKKDLYNTLNNLSLEKKGILQKIKLLQAQLEEMRESYKKAKDVLLVHYHKILSEGKDIRKEGLIWVIKAIWNLGENVVMSHIPTFLDEGAIRFLFDYAKRTIMYNKLLTMRRIFAGKIKSENMKTFLALKQFKENFNEKKTYFKKEIFQTSLTKFKAKSPEIKRTSRLLIRDRENQTDTFKIKDFEKMFESDQKILTNEVIEKMNKLKEMDEQIHKFQKEMNHRKRTELDRLNKEFYLKDYQRRFQVNQKTVIGAIIGEEFLNEELYRAQREQRNYFIKVKKLRTINAFEIAKIAKWSYVEEEEDDDENVEDYSAEDHDD